MFSLVITIVAVALVALLALAAIYYGATSYQSAGARARASTAISQSSQVLGAAELHFVEKKAWSNSMADLVGLEYLKDAPVLQGLAKVPVPWTQPMAATPTYWALKSLDVEACREVNRMARGDNGIYKMARPGLVTQCFGLAEPFTVVTTRQGLGEHGGLDAVIRFVDDPEVGFDPNGGGWAHEPTQTRGGNGSTPTDTDKGTPDGSYLDGDIKVTLPGQGGIGSNVVNVGSVSSNGKVVQEITLTNTGTGPMNMGGAVASGDFKVTGSSCSGVLQPGQSCTVTVEAGPYPDLTESRELTGNVVVKTDKGNVDVGLSGVVHPAPVGPVQVGLTTSEPGDTGTLLVFPDTEIGQTSYKWVRVQNVGGTITYDSVPFRVSAPFSVMETDCGGKLANGAYCQVRLAFSPTVVQYYSGTDNTMSMQANGSSLAVGLAGRGKAKPVAGVSVLPETIDHGSQFALGRYTAVVTIRNNGETLLTFTTNPTITEGADSWLVSATTCGATIARNGSCTVSVQFDPDNAQVYSGKLQMAFAEAGVGTKEVTLAGTAINPLKDGTLAAALPAGRAASPYKTSPDLSTGWALATGAAIDKSHLVLTVDPTAALPSGLSINPTTMKIEGTPANSTGGTVPVKIQAKYQDKFSHLRQFTLSIASSALSTTQISTKYLTVCAVTSEGGIKCWGDNSSGQLGDGSTQNRLSPVDVQGLNATMKGVSVGDYHVCGITTAGGVKCWGKGASGQLGNGMTANSTVPVDVPGLQGVQQLALGVNFSCALESSGRVMCWGLNTSGELGVGATSSSSSVPVQTYAGGVQSIAVGYYHGCAALTSGKVECWGFGVGGQLGTNGATARAPREVPGITDARVVSAGSNFSCALTGGGAAKCWGTNNIGQLGDGSKTIKYSAVDVAGLNSGVTMLASSPGHSCAVHSGVLKCWGENTNNKLANISNTHAPTPDLVQGWAGAVGSIAAGFDHTCAATSTGATYCWGGNNAGQLGTGRIQSEFRPAQVGLN